MSAGGQIGLYYFDFVILATFLLFCLLIAAAVFVLSGRKDPLPKPLAAALLVAWAILFLVWSWLSLVLSKQWNRMISIVWDVLGIVVLTIVGAVYPRKVKMIIVSLMLAAHLIDLTLVATMEMKFNADMEEEGYMKARNDTTNFIGNRIIHHLPVFATLGMAAVMFFTLVHLIAQRWEQLQAQYGLIPYFVAGHAIVYIPLIWFFISMQLKKMTKSEQTGALAIAVVLLVADLILLIVHPILCYLEQDGRQGHKLSILAMCFYFLDMIMMICLLATSPIRKMSIDSNVQGLYQISYYYFDFCVAVTFLLATLLVASLIFYFNEKKDVLPRMLQAIVLLLWAAAFLVWCWLSLLVGKEWCRVISLVWDAIGIVIISLMGGFYFRRIRPIITSTMLACHLVDLILVALLFVEAQNDRVVDIENPTKLLGYRIIHHLPILSSFGLAAVMFYTLVHVIGMNNENLQNSFGLIPYFVAVHAVVYLPASFWFISSLWGAAEGSNGGRMAVGIVLIICDAIMFLVVLLLNFLEQTGKHGFKLSVLCISFYFVDMVMWICYLAY